MSFTSYSHSLHQKKHEPSKLTCYSFSDELTSLGMKGHELSEFSIANGCCVRKLTILDEKFFTHDHI
jgi:hypothetical protein